MPQSPRPFAALAALLTLLAGAAPARAGFVTYTFRTDSSDGGGSLAGRFRVDQADLLDGVLSTADVRDYSFTFTTPSGAATLYALNAVLPDLEVDPTTGVPTGPPTGFGGSVLGDQVGADGLAQADLTPDALTPGSSFWVALSQPTGETDSGFGHWEIGEAPAAAAPAPPGAALALAGAGCLAAGRLLRRRPAGA